MTQRSLADYERHQGDGKRFHFRCLQYTWQVYGVRLDHICECHTEWMAKQIAESLEAMAGHLEETEHE